MKSIHNPINIFCPSDTSKVNQNISQRHKSFLREINRYTNQILNTVQNVRWLYNKSGLLAGIDHTEFRGK